MARIYVSSTSSDLGDERQAVSGALRRLGHVDVAMEYYVAEDKRPLDRCLEDVRSCDVYVGIFAWRYGHIPATGNPEQRSITELEYRCAAESGKTCLIFLLDEDAPWPRRKFDSDLSKVEALRAELKGSGRIVAQFTDKEELARKVNEAVITWERRSGLVVDRDTDWRAYRDAVVDRHRWVRLQVIAGASRERDPLRIPLTEVFEPQFVIAGASGADVPDEVRQYQQEIYGIRAPVADEPVADETAASEDEATPAPGESPDTDAGEELPEQSIGGKPEQVLDVLGRERNQVFLGGPGSGKSTLLQYVMLRVCEPAGNSDKFPAHVAGDPVPFLVELRNYILQRDSDFVSHIVRRSSEFYAVGLDADSVRKVLTEDGKALVFFDGLDEVFDPDERRRVIDQFQAFSGRYPGCRMVVTSRIAGYDRVALGLAGFAHYTVMPLTLGHIRDFAGRWYRHYTLEGTERTAQGLVQRIIDSPRLLDLAGNPLLLTMMAVIYKDRDLPNERWRLYERCAETLLEDWDLSKGIEREDFKLAVNIRTAQKSEMLQRVAMYMVDHGQAGSELNAIAYGPLREILSGYLETKYQRPEGDAEAIAVDILQHLMERTYVLAGVGERVFGFVHRTFMEYFAACCCLAEFNARRSDFGWLTRDIFGAHWPEPHWEEVLQLLIAMLHGQRTPIRDVVTYLRDAEHVSPPFNVAFAAKCLGEAGDAEDQGLITGLLHDLITAVGGYGTRRKGYEGFVDKTLEAFAVLAPLVAAPQELTAAIERLGSSGERPVRMAAWQMGFALRARADRLTYAIGSLGDPEEVVRRGAIAALEREWPGRADLGVILAQVVRNDRHSRVRLAALSALQRSWPHDPAILDAIDARADTEPASTVIKGLIAYLASAWPGNRRALRLLLRLAAPRPRMEPAVQREVLTTAVPGLMAGWPGDSEALTSLRLRFDDDNDPDTRRHLAGLVAAQWTGEASTLRLLRDWMTAGSDPAVRYAIVLALADKWMARDDYVLDVLDVLNERLANDDYWPVRQAAFVGIAARGLLTSDPGIGDFIRGRLAREADADVRREMLRSFVGTPGPLAGLIHIGLLRDLVAGDPDPGVRETMIRAVGAGQNWAVHKALGAFLRERAGNPDPSVLAAALDFYWHPEYSGWISTSVDLDQVEFLCDRARTDGAPSVRALALSLLAEKITEQVRAFLQARSVDDPDASVRQAAQEALVTRDRLRSLRDGPRYGLVTGASGVRPHSAQEPS